MNHDERIVQGYLNSLGSGPVVHEPDGKVPPDFLVDGRIAIEVRRLNQHVVVNGRARGLEEDTIPLRKAFEKLLAEFDSPENSGTWFVMFRFRRPILDWGDLKPRVRGALRDFLRAPVDEAWRIPINDRFVITTLRASNTSKGRFLLGGYTDMDAGGWVVSETVRNAAAYIADKARKVAPYRSKYPIWWLILVDYIGLARDEDEVKQHITRTDDWDRVLLLSPMDGRAYEI